MESKAGSWGTGDRRPQMHSILQCHISWNRSHRLDNCHTEQPQRKSCWHYECLCDRTISEKIWTVLGPEWGELQLQGEKAIIVRALYGLKSSDAAFHKHLAACMTALSYVPCLADPDLWMKPACEANGDNYYSHILCYIDDILIIHHEADRILDRVVGKFFMLKPESVGKPNAYLGAKLREHQCPNGVRTWTMSPSNYMQEAVKNCHKHMKEHFDGKYKLPKTARMLSHITMNPNLKPQLPFSLKLHLTTCPWLAYQDGKLKLAKLMLQLRCLCCDKHNLCMFFDPTYPDIDYEAFNDGADWKQFMAMLKKPSLPMLPNVETKILISKWWWTVTMLEINPPDILALDILSLQICPWLHGWHRSNPQLKVLCSVPSLSLWNKKLRLYVAYTTNNK